MNHNFPFLGAFVFTILMMTSQAFSDENTRPPTIEGAWSMKKWQVIDKLGNKAEFCKGGNGILIYEQTGHVSTSINCPPTAQDKEPADDFNRMFFYAGTYTVADGVITKKVSNASSLGLIGKTVLRNIEELTTDKLVLTGNFGAPGTTMWILWERK